MGHLTPATSWRIGEHFVPWCFDEELLSIPTIAIHIHQLNIEACTIRRAIGSGDAQAQHGNHSPKHGRTHSGEFLHQWPNTVAELPSRNDATRKKEFYIL
jgi:hypothetical protein